MDKKIEVIPDFILFNAKDLLLNCFILREQREVIPSLMKLINICMFRKNQ